MRWVIVAVGVLFGAGTAWLVHRPVAPVEVVVIADANADEAPPMGRQVAAESNAAAVSPASPPPAPLPPEAEQALAKWAADGRSRAAAAALHKAGATALAETVEAIDGLRRAGQGALLRDELEEADARWGEAILRERELPLERPSAASNDLRGRLAAAWHDRALVHESRGQLAVAFAIWQRATAIDPSHLDSLAGLQRVAGSAARERDAENPVIPLTWPKPTDRH